jgi:hypothetical protein
MKKCCRSKRHSCRLFSLAFFGTRAGFVLKKSVRLVREVWYRAVHAQDIRATTESSTEILTGIR